jgi:hypothetical protein
VDKNGIGAYGNNFDAEVFKVSIFLRHFFKLRGADESEIRGIEKQNEPFVGKIREIDGLVFFVMEYPESVRRNPRAYFSVKKSFFFASAAPSGVADPPLPARNLFLARTIVLVVHILFSLNLLLPFYCITAGRNKNFSGKDTDERKLKLFWKILGTYPQKKTQKKRGVKYTPP